MEEGNIEGQGKVQKGDAEEVEGLEVDGEKEVCCCGKQVVFFSFSATKQDEVGPSLQSRNTLITFCTLLYTLYDRTVSVDEDNTL